MKIDDCDSAPLLLERLRDKELAFAEFRFCDIYGFLKSFTIPMAYLQLTDDGDSFEGKGFDGSSIAGLTGIERSDLQARPDWRSCCVPDDPGDTAIFFCTLHDLQGQAFIQGDARYQLINKLQQIKEQQGYHFLMGAELEFFLLRKLDNRWHRDSLQTQDARGYFDLTSIGFGDIVLERIVKKAQGMGIAIAQYNHEVAPSQFEIALVPTHPVQLADNIIALRHIIREVARNEENLFATFMPKPFAERDGSALHLNITILKNDESKENESERLSIIGRSFMAGLCRYGRELALASNQWINSYKRFQPDFDAPLYLKCSKDLRATSIHCGQIGDPITPRWGIQVSHPDSACNPYLSFLSLLAAGMAGENHENLVIHKDEKSLTDAIEEEKTQRLPQSFLPADLGEAIDIFRNSAFAKSVFGSELCHKLVALKTKEEWRKFEHYVTDWEINEYRSRF